MPGVKAIVTGKDIARTPPRSCSAARRRSTCTTWATTCSRTTRRCTTVTPSPRSRRRPPRSHATRPNRIVVVYEPLPPITGVDQAMAPDAVLLHEKYARNIASRMELQARRPGQGLRRRRRRRRARVPDADGASGLHRAARLRGALRRGRPRRRLVQHAGSVRRPRCVRRHSRHGRRAHQGDPQRDRRRLRRQDRRLPRAARHPAVAQGESTGEDGHVARRSVPRDRSDVRHRRSE